MERKVELIGRLAEECQLDGHPSTAGILRLTVTALTRPRPTVDESLEACARELQTFAALDRASATRWPTLAETFRAQAEDKERAAEILLA